MPRKRRARAYGSALNHLIIPGTRLLPGRKRLRRASPHCSLVNRVRSGRKQPQLIVASAGGRARHLFGIEDREKAVMSYQVLARKWRPRTFESLIGQEHVVKALRNALDQKRLHHAYLFSGTRGVGKTTLARILAKQ